MKKNVLLSIRGCQNYQGQEPDVIEMVTEGTLELQPDGWEISYEESELTGLKGVHTSFASQNGVITLTRSGAFQEGVSHDSLYQTEFGALVITVTARALQDALSEQGGTVDLSYSIEIEQTAAGTIDYHLDVKIK